MPEEAIENAAEPAMRRKIALVGFTASLHDAPWGDPEWDVLPCNNLHRQIPDLWPKATGWFNLHPWQDIKSDQEHVDWLKEAPFAVWMFPGAIRAAEADGIIIPNAQPFPHQEIVDWAKSLELAGAQYFTNSVAWMVALAMVRLLSTGDGTGELALYGVDMATGTEYQSQRPSCEYWLAQAEGRGLKVTVAPRADLLKCMYLYGVDEQASVVGEKFRGRIAELEQKLGEMRQQWEHLRSQMEQTRYYEHQFTGALEDSKYWYTVWLQQPGDIRQGGADPYSTEAVEPQAVVGA